MSAWLAARNREVCPHFKEKVLFRAAGADDAALRGWAGNKICAGSCRGFVVALEIEVLARKLISYAEKQHGDAHKTHATKRRGRSGIVPVCEGQQSGHRAVGDARIWKFLVRKQLGRKSSAVEAIDRDDMGPSLGR